MSPERLSGFQGFRVEGFSLECGIVRLQRVQGFRV